MSFWDLSTNNFKTTCENELVTTLQNILKFD